MNTNATVVAGFQIPAGIQLSEQGAMLVQSWNEGLEPVSVHKLYDASFVTVAKHKGEQFHVTAFFTIGATWNASADAQGVTAEQAFRALAKRML